MCSLWPLLRRDSRNLYTPYPGAGNLNARGLFILGLEHDDVHHHHLAKIVQQIQDSSQ